MPAQAKSLEITERYRSGMIRLRKQGQREAKRLWTRVRPDDLDGTFPLGELELTVLTLQREAARLSSAYLASFIASELGEPERPPAISVWDKTFGGNPLREGLRSAIIKAKTAIKEGTDPREATNTSRAILVSDVGLFIDTAARESLRQGMEMDDRIVGYQRAVKGTCAACSGSTTYEAFSPNAPVVPLATHPNCVCVAEPIVTGIPNNVPRPTGPELFASYSPEKQDEMLGPAAAEKVRQGEATLSDFVEYDGNFIRQKPVEDLPGEKAWREEDHPRGGDPKNPGRFSRGGGGKKKRRFKRGRKRGALAKMPEAVENVLWDASLQSTFFWLGIPEISDSGQSWPREIKRTSQPGEWRCVFIFRFRLKVDVDGVGPAGSWHEFRAVMRFTSQGYEFRAEEWGGPPELRPGYVPPEEEPV